MRWWRRLAPADLETLVRDTADELLAKAGPGATIIVLAAVERGGHSFPAFSWRGSCLPTIGLLEIAPTMIRGTMPDVYRISHPRLALSDEV